MRTTPFVALVSLVAAVLMLPALSVRAEDPQPTSAPDHATVDFDNDILPILTRFGCNSGPCHGKSRGQGGFQLSLLGFDPDYDFDSIVKEGRGRRVFPAVPENSLLVRKPRDSLLMAVVDGWKLTAKSTSCFCDGFARECLARQKVPPIWFESPSSRIPLLSGTAKPRSLPSLLTTQTVPLAM